MIQKQAIDVPFAKGLDTKTDAKRIAMGNFKSLENSVFTKGGLLQKRNGYGSLSSLPDTTYSYLTTFNQNLTAVGNNIAAYNASSASWVQKGSIQPMSISTLPLIRNNLNQTSCDSAISDNGLVCTVYTETNGSSTTNKFVIADATTGQNITAPAAIPVASGTVSGGMRVFYLGTNFILVFTNTITANAHLQYVAINSFDTSMIGANTDIASLYVPFSTLSWDGYVVGNRLYIAYNTTVVSQRVSIVTLSSTLAAVTAPVSFAGYKATMMSVIADISIPSSPVLYVSFYSSSSSTGYVIVLDANLNVILNPLLIIASGTVLNITAAARNGFATIFWEVQNAYSYDSGIPTNYINAISVQPLGTSFHSVFSSGAGTITASSPTGLVSGMHLVDNTTSANIAPGTTFTISGSTLTLSINTAGNSASSPGDVLAAAFVSPISVLVRSVGLASKAFKIMDSFYVLTAYQSNYQPTYFLIKCSGSSSDAPLVAAKLAYENGGGYLTTGLPNVSISDTTASIPYLFKDLIQAVNKNTNVPSGNQIAGIYSQTGINLGSFDIGTQGLDTAEIGNDLHLTGGFLWMYDGYLPVEHNFFLYPDNVEVTTATGSGNLSAQDYYYQVTYEWTDNQGNAFRSAPSIPIKQTTTTASSTNTIKVPTLRLTYKTANPVKIVVYRWSVAQQEYYQVTSITSPTLNDTTVDSVSITDTLADITILGNNLIYTTGGVVEDVNAPASNLLTLFDTRLWLVDAEDPNLLWYSKQVIEATPVEMSDLFTLYIAPTTAAQGSTGPITAISVMDDKLIIFKQNAIYYINGSGPDNTGANSQYSQPIFITSTVGCKNQQSIVFMPQGLMFQSDKGIWLLGRGLDTSYIGAPVEDFNSGIVESAQNIPQTNQVRFILSTGITLMYDYYYSQWGTFAGVPAISSCIYNNLHTYINKYGAAYQETPGAYLDGSTPVLMSFTTGPLRLGDLQNYQRAYFFYLLGDYITPHKLLISIAYDYSPTPSHSTIISPTNFNGVFGSDNLYGQSTPFGGHKVLENWRVFLNHQRCQAFSISLQEVYDSSFGVPAGAGLTLSGINLVMGMKKGFRPIPASQTVG